MVERVARHWRRRSSAAFEARPTIRAWRTVRTKRGLAPRRKQRVPLQFGAGASSRGAHSQDEARLSTEGVSSACRFSPEPERAAEAHSQEDDVKLDGKVAIVTGAGRNVGEAIAQAFVEEGASVAVVDWLEERAQAVAGAINAEREGANSSWFRAIDQRTPRLPLACGRSRSSEARISFCEPYVVVVLS